MSAYTQAGRALSIATPLGPDALLLEKLSGVEGLSRVYGFQLDLLAEEPIAFKPILGKPAAVKLTLPNGTGRYFHGILRRVSQGEWVAGPKGANAFLRYRAELVPSLWLLGKRVQSRIYQNSSVPDILKQVLKDDWHIDYTSKLTATYPARNYCVQYQETDLAFVSRLMEEEGISYYFEHGEADHKLVLIDSPTMFVDLARPAAIVHDPTAAGWDSTPRIHAWTKRQELTVTKHIVSDWSFQLPKVVSETAASAGSVECGTVSHDLAVVELESFDHVAGYASRFDGVAMSGAAQPQELQKVFDYQTRLAKIRQERDAARALRARGQGDAGHFMSGGKFTLTRHFDGDGEYLLTRVRHHASIVGQYTTAEERPAEYSNDFECMPAQLPYRPPRRTPRPRVHGSQTAIVVGTASSELTGEQVVCDKFGRVKVQFHWDRQGKNDASSSCWLRVSQAWAGKGFGAFHLPRTGNEVIVDFLDGDPDRPIIVGTVYNADQVTPLGLPEHALHSGIRSRSLSGDPTQYHEIRFDDTPGDETLHLHSERHLHQESEESMTHFVGWGPAVGSGSGSGDTESKKGKWEPSWHQFVKGKSFEGKISPIAVELLIGMGIDLTLGINAEVVAGLNGEVVLGCNSEAVIGVNLEGVIGPEITYHKGPSLEWQNGNVFGKTVGSVMDIIENGDSYEILNGTGSMVSAINSWVVEMYEGRKLAAHADLDGLGKALKDAKKAETEAKQAETEANEADRRATRLAQGANYAQGEDAKAAGQQASAARETANAKQQTATAKNQQLDAAKQIKAAEMAKFAAANNIVHEEVMKTDFTLVYNDMNMISKDGNIYLTALGAGKKIVIQAETIELRGKTIDGQYVEAGDTKQAPACLTAETERATGKVAHLEEEFATEALSLKAKQAAGALEFCAGAVLWVVVCLVLVALGIAGAECADL